MGAVDGCVDAGKEVVLPEEIDEEICAGWEIGCEQAVALLLPAAWWTASLLLGCRMKTTIPISGHYAMSVRWFDPRKEAKGQCPVTVSVRGLLACIRLDHPVEAQIKIRRKERRS